MKKSVFVRLCSLLLCVVLLATLCPVTASAVGKESKASFVSRLNFKVEDDAVVRAIVVYEGDSAADLQQKGKAPSVTAAVSRVEKGQKALTKTITEGYGATLKYSYSALLNGVAVDVSYGQLKEIEKLDGVKAVYLANSYSAPKYSVGKQPLAVSAGETLTFDRAVALGASGQGTVIAILDTGLNTSHEAFSVTDGLLPAVTADSVKAVKDSGRGLNGDGNFISTKIPYSFDYADWDSDISTLDSHGTGVAGIAAGNNGDDYYGIARDAQILGMKIFSDESGSTDSSIYFAAIEDAYLLGADVINMSLGSQNGFTYDFELEDEVYGDIYTTLKEEGVFICCAAGNEYSQGYWEYAHNWFSYSYSADGVTIDYADYGVVGSPSTYASAISVASAENAFSFGYAIAVGDSVIPFLDSGAGTEADFFANFSGETLAYELIPNYGADADYEGIDVTGKIAVVSRGDITFEEKLEFAYNHGAIGMVCYNNTAGSISMAIDTFEAPAVSVLQSAYDILASNPSKTFTIPGEAVKIPSETAYLMSDFSSWGVTPDLKLKPQITGIGGNVWSPICGGTDVYESVSGTSMATPIVSGAIAVYLSALRDVGLVKGMTGEEIYNDVYDVMLSSAITVYDADDFPYSPRKQGAGITVFDYFANTAVSFEDPIVNLGDDPEKTGVYTINAQIKIPFGFGTDDLEVSLYDAEILCDYWYEDADLGGAYNTLVSEYLSAEVVTDKDSYIVDGDSEYVDVVITITLSEEDKEYLSAYPNGGYVEGYLYFSVKNLTDLRVELSDAKITFMGFYGDWTDAPVFETYDWGEVVDTNKFLNTTVVDDDGFTYADYGYTYYDFLEMNVGYNEGYLTYQDEIVGVLGDNLYDWVDYDYDRMAFTTAANEGYYLADSFTIYPSLLRNVRHIIMTVSNAKTGEVYYVDDTEYGIKNFYDYDYGDFYQGTLFTWDGTYLDENGDYAYVEDNTEILVTFQTQIDYEGAELVTEREYTMYIDNTAPEYFYDWDAESKQLTLYAKDNRYISNIMAYGGDYEVYYANIAVEDTVPGMYTKWEIDLSDADFSGYSEFYLELQDYATNYNFVSIPVDEDASSDVLKAGDVNLDGFVDSADASAILRYDLDLLSENEQFDEINILLGDVNCDGTTDSADASIVLRYDLGLIEAFEAEDLDYSAIVEYIAAEGLIYTPNAG